MQPKQIQTPKARSTSLLVRLTIGLIGMFAFFQVYSVQSILPVLMDEFGISELKAGLLVGATVMGVAVMSPITGMVSDALGRKRIIALSLMLLAVPTIWMAYAMDVKTMMILRFLQGVAIPGITVVTIAYVGEEYQNSSLTKLMVFYVSGTVMGGFLGRFTLGHLQDWVGWRHALIGMGLVTLLSAAWIAWALPDSKNFKANPNFLSSITVLKSHLKNRYLLSACLLGFCVLFTLVGGFTFINLHLAHAPYYLSSGQLGNIFAVYLLGVVITPVTSWLLQRFGTTKTVNIAIAVALGGIVVTLFQPLWAIVVGLAIMSSGIFISQSATISYIAMNVNKGRSLASGLYYMSYYIGGSMGAWVCGLIYQLGRWQAVVIALVVVQSLAILIVNQLMNKHKE